MFHHRSCGTTQLVALMAAHRAAPDSPGSGLRQQDITRLTEALLATAAPKEVWRPEILPRPAMLHQEEARG